MRFLLPLTAFAASAAAIDNFEQLFIEFFGKCGANCVDGLYAEATGCGDPGSSSSNSCYCGLTYSDIQNMDLTPAVPCIVDCDSLNYDLLSDSNALVNKLMGYQEQLCGSSSSSSSTDSDSSDTPTTTTTSHTAVETVDLSGTTSLVATSSTTTSGSAPSATGEITSTSPASSAAATSPPTGAASSMTRGGLMGAGMGVVAAYLLL